ncbi:MAG: carbonate dehydratase [Sandaracinaceae bacterium]|nr:carbonate dehydratase [Sandaracinaceae bacterium]
MSEGTAKDKNDVDVGYRRLLDGNRRWVEERLAGNPDYFKHLASGQKPKFLWIGCADSRMPANEITGTEPGEVFVHRNIANMVVGTDLNMLSVVQYAVEHLEVEHIIVCGHYGCGGIAAALSNDDYGLLNIWLGNIKDVHRLHQRELRAYEDPARLARRMTELNVIEQVYNLGKTEILQRAWQKRGAPEIHGWVYDIAEGFIRDLGVNFRSADRMEEQYRFEWHADRD